MTLIALRSKTAQCTQRGCWLGNPNPRSSTPVSYTIVEALSGQTLAVQFWIPHNYRPHVAMPLYVWVGSSTARAAYLADADGARHVTETLGLDVTNNLFTSLPFPYFALFIEPNTGKRVSGGGNFNHDPANMKIAARAIVQETARLSALYNIDSKRIDCGGYSAGGTILYHAWYEWARTGVFTPRSILQVDGHPDRAGCAEAGSDAGGPGAFGITTAGNYGSLLATDDNPHLGASFTGTDAAFFAELARVCAPSPTAFLHMASYGSSPSSLTISSGGTQGSTSVNVSDATKVAASCTIYFAGGTPEYARVAANWNGVNPVTLQAGLVNAHANGETVKTSTWNSEPTLFCDALDAAGRTAYVRQNTNSATTLPTYSAANKTILSLFSALDHATIIPFCKWNGSVGTSYWDWIAALAALP